MELNRFGVTFWGVFVAFLCFDAFVFGSASRAVPNDGDDLQIITRKDSSTFVQMKPRHQVNLVMTGTAVVLPGTSIVLICPLETSSTVNIIWTKNGEVLQRGGVSYFIKGNERRQEENIRVNRVNVENIVNTVEGIYVCLYGKKSAHIKIRLHSLDSATNLYRERRGFETLSRKKRQVFDADETQENEVILESKETPKKADEGSTESGYWDDYYDYSHTPYKFIMSEWGPCSASGCEGVGVQKRNMSCEVIYDWYFRKLEEEMCMHHGLDKPEGERKCNEDPRVECPQWTAGDWQECSASRCIGNGTALSERSVHCTLDGEILADGKCASSSKPDTRRHCDQSDCQAEWAAGGWSGCSRSCGGEGVRLRLIQCRWKYNQSLAFVKHCNQEQPRSVIACETPSCDQERCTDTSNYCRLAVRLDMCRFSHFRRRCCKSCERYVANQPSRQPAFVRVTQPVVARRTTTYPLVTRRRTVSSNNRVSPHTRFSSRNYRQFNRNYGAFSRRLDSRTENDVRFNRIRY